MKKQIKNLHLIIMFLLSVLALIAIVLEMFFSLAPNLNAILHKVTIGILIIFALDFAFFFYRSKDKLEFLKENWYSLLVLIPPLKIIKAFKVFKAIKGLKVYKTFKLGKKLEKSKKDSV